MKRLLTGCLAVVMLISTMFLSVAAAEEQRKGAIEYYTRTPEETPSFEALFGKGNSLAEAQALMAEFTVHTESGWALTAQSRPYTVDEQAPVTGPVLYPVRDRRAAHTTWSIPGTVTYLNEKMEPVLTLNEVDQIMDYYASGAEGTFYLGALAGWYGPIIDGWEEVTTTYYDHYGKVIDYSAKEHNAKAKLGDTYYVGNLCAVNGNTLAMWNRDTHTIGNLLDESLISIFFDENGNAYALDYDDDYRMRIAVYDQAGARINCPVRYSVEYARGRNILAYLFLEESYIPTIKGEEGLYPYRSESGLYGYQDDHGAWAIAPKFDFALPFSGSFALVSTSDTGGHTLIDRSGAQMEGMLNAQLIPGLGYLVQGADSAAAGNEQVKSRIYRLDGTLWISSKRTLEYYSGWGSAVSIDNPAGTFEKYELDLKTGVLSAGNEIIRRGKLLIRDIALGTTDGQVLSCVKENDFAKYQFQWGQLYKKFGNSETDFGITYKDQYHTDGKKIVQDAIVSYEQGDYFWVEKDAERGYVDHGGNWVYRESWESGMTYLDVSSEAWYYEPLKFIWDEGLLGGKSRAEFAPNINLIRIDLITMLYRKAGRPVVEFSGDQFPVNDAYSAPEPVFWGYQNQIITRYGDRQFGPWEDITREQAVAILYRFAQWSGTALEDAATLGGFVDADQVSEYAKNPMEWAVANAIISGKPGLRIDPKGSITRAEMAAIIYRFCQQNEGV